MSYAAAVPGPPRHHSGGRARAMTLVATALLLASCASTGDDDVAGGDRAAGEADVAARGTEVDGTDRDDNPPSETTPSTESTSATERYTYPPPPDVAVPDGGNVAADEAADRIVDGVADNQVVDPAAVGTLADSGDARYAWMVSDLLRFTGGDEANLLVGAFETLTGVSIDADPELSRSPWASVTNHLIAWDTPDYPGYRQDKAALFTLIDDRWEPFFSDADAEIDWRQLSWGGVLLDDRPLDDSGPCARGCIPALDDPPTTDAAGGDWYPDERTVFGVVIGDEALAIPLNIAEVHEMFNLTLGGRRLAIPYCTLCGSAQAYFTDQADGRPVAGADEIPLLRTSGLLVRSNKVMYDLATFSVFDTFTGAAVSGPLQDAGVTLAETTVVRSTWADWKAEHPDTQIVAEDGGIGRDYRLDPLGDRDADGPIFPIGDVDPRLDVQEFVVGVLLDDGTALAFPSAPAQATLDSGESVELDGVELRSSGDGFVAVDASSGAEVTAHEAFWFAWSQFHPDTLVWNA